MANVPDWLLRNLVRVSKRERQKSRRGMEAVRFSPDWRKNADAAVANSDAAAALNFTDAAHQRWVQRSELWVSRLTQANLLT